MRMQLRRGVVVGLFAAGCGSSSGGGAIPIDDLQSQYLAGVCAFVVRCDVVSDAALCAWLYTPIYQATTFNSFGASVAAAKAGDSTYDGVTARRCVDSLRNLSCTAFTIDPACQKIFTGTLADGSRCIVDTECLPGSFCAKPAATTGTATCDGTCVPGGTACNNDSHCTGGQVCDGSAPTATSVGTCVMPIVGVAGGPCGTNNSCEPGLWCSTVSAPFTCMPLAQAGGPCEPVNGCAAGLICVPGDNGTPSTCMTDARKGEACQAIYQCGGFFSTLVCDETAHKCVDAPKSGPCAGLGVCDFTTSYCDGTQATPTCTPIKALGAACNTTGAGAECGTLSNMKCQATVSGGTTGTCVSTIAVVCTP